MDRYNVLSPLDQRLPHGQEVADRRLRGGRQLRVRAQPLVEPVELPRQLELALGRLPPADVQADLMYAFAVRERSRQVMRAVGRDRYRGHSARDATATPYANASASSPDSYISVTMSHPPTSSPFANS